MPKYRLTRRLQDDDGKLQGYTVVPVDGGWREDARNLRTDEIIQMILKGDAFYRDGEPAPGTAVRPVLKTVREDGVETDNLETLPKGPWQ